MKFEMLFTWTILAAAVTSFTAEVRSSIDLLVPAVLTFTLFQTSICSAYAIPAPQADSEWWALERRHHKHHGHKNGTADANSSKVKNNSEKKNKQDKDKKKNKNDGKANANVDPAGANNGTATDCDKGKHHNKNKDKDNSASKANAQDDGKGKDGATPSCPPNGAADPNNNGNNAAAGNGTGSLPPGFPPAPPKPGFTAGQKRKSNVRRVVKPKKVEHVPYSPKTAVYEPLYF